jgi:hypothetical protein
MYYIVNGSANIRVGSTNFQKVNIHVNYTINNAEERLENDTLATLLTVHPGLDGEKQLAGNFAKKIVVVNFLRSRVGLQVGTRRGIGEVQRREVAFPKLHIKLLGAVCWGGIVVVRGKHERRSQHLVCNDIGRRR